MRVWRQEAWVRWGDRVANGGGGPARPGYRLMERGAGMGLRATGGEDCVVRMSQCSMCLK